MDKRRTLEHVLPWSAGGKSDLTNLVVACAPCNHKRSSHGLLHFLLEKKNGQKV